MLLKSKLSSFRSTVKLCTTTHLRDPNFVAVVQRYLCVTKIENETPKWSSLKTRGRFLEVVVYSGLMAVVLASHLL
jgi:hypothetical protein